MWNKGLYVAHIKLLPAEEHILHFKEYHLRGHLQENTDSRYVYKYTYSGPDLNQAITRKIMCEKFWEELITYFRFVWYNMDPIENITSNSVVSVSLAVGTCLLSFCQATIVSSGSTIPAFWCSGGGGKAHIETAKWSYKFPFCFFPPKIRKVSYKLGAARYLDVYDFTLPLIFTEKYAVQYISFYLFINPNYVFAFGNFLV
jgi:hypothetical protein